MMSGLICWLVMSEIALPAPSPTRSRLGMPSAVLIDGAGAGVPATGACVEEPEDFLRALAIVLSQLVSSRHVLSPRAPCAFMSCDISRVVPSARARIACVSTVQTTSFTARHSSLTGLPIADTTTTNYHWGKPDVGAFSDSRGTQELKRARVRQSGGAA